MRLFYQLLLLLIIYPIGIAFCLWGLKKIVRQWAKDSKQENKATFYIPVVEGVVWILFLVYVFFVLALINTPIFTVVFAILFFLTKEFLQNFLIGILFRLEKGDLRGVPIRILADEGVLFSYEKTKLCLTLENGNSLYIPYEKLYRQGFVQITKAEHSKEQIVRLFWAENYEITEDELVQIRKKTLLNPYVVANENIQLIKGEENGKKWLQITYTLANPERAVAVKQELEREIATLVRGVCQ